MIGDTASGAARRTLVHIDILIGPGRQCPAARQIRIERYGGATDLAVPRFQDQVAAGNDIGQPGICVEHTVPPFDPNFPAGLHLADIQIIVLIARTQVHMRACIHIHLAGDIQVDIIPVEDQDGGNRQGRGGRVEHNL